MGKADGGGPPPRPPAPAHTTPRCAPRVCGADSEGKMQVLQDIVGFLYLVTIVWLAVYGIGSLVNIGLYLRAKKRLRGRSPQSKPGVWPRVTIQLPVFNEKYTVERLLRAVTQLDYPTERLQIQVLDDSTDDTAEV